MVSVKNPSVPFAQSAPDGKVDPGQKYVVKGHPLESAGRFSINFIQASTRQKIFHLEFRFDQGESVRNTSFPTGTWGTEERSALTLERNKPFKIEIKVLEDRFHVEIDDHHYCDYHHRAGVNGADAITVKGDVHIKSFKISD